MKTSGLGKGLSALLGSIENEETKAPLLSQAEKAIQLEAVDKIHEVKDKKLQEKTNFNTTSTSNISRTSINTDNKKDANSRKKVKGKKELDLNTSDSTNFAESSFNSSLSINNRNEYQYILIKDIEVNPYQPRKEFDEIAITELAKAIANSNFITPLIVNRSDNKYILVAGERRLRACKLLGLSEVPAIIKTLTDRQMMQIAIIENVQRKDLNPIEEAKAYENMQNKLNIDINELAETLGLPNYYISQKIKLTKLPESIQNFVAQKDLAESAAVALLRLDSQEAMIATAKIAVRQHMSRASVEKLVDKILVSKGVAPKSSEYYFRSRYQHISDAFKDSLGWDLKIKPIQNGIGKIEIEFKDEVGLKDIYSKLEEILK